MARMVRGTHALLVLWAASIACTSPVRTVEAPLQYRNLPLRYHVQVIANEEYEHWAPLKNPISDAKAVSHLLEAKYGYVVHEPVYNGKRRDVYGALGRLQQELTEQDALLIYYSGHGYSDNQLQTGYWIPVDGDRENRSEWLTTDDIAKLLYPIRARHLLVIADSCYAGKLLRSVDVTSKLTAELAASRTRRALTSGGDEPVEDGTPGALSIFARYLVKVLADNERDVLRGTELWLRVEELVANNADQRPRYGVIREIGDEGGDFLFLRREPAEATGPTPSGLLPAVVNDTIDKNSARFRACYDEGVASGVNPNGRIDVQFDIEPNGSVSKALSGGAQLPDSSVVSCVIAAFRSWTFPQSESGATVGYTVALPLPADKATPTRPELSSAAVGDIMRKSEPGFRACYSPMARNADVRVDVQFDVEPDGSVSKIDTEYPVESARDAGKWGELTKCVTATVFNLRFPHSARGATIKYTIAFPQR